MTRKKKNKQTDLAKPTSWQIEAVLAAKEIALRLIDRGSIIMVPASIAMVALVFLASNTTEKAMVGAMEVALALVNSHWWNAGLILAVVILLPTCFASLGIMWAQRKHYTAEIARLVDEKRQLEDKMAKKHLTDEKGGSDD